MNDSPEALWQACLDIIRDNVSVQSFRTWFEPLKAVSFQSDGELHKLTVKLPSRFYYEWLEEHYFALLQKTLTKVLGPGGRLYYDIVIERLDEGDASMLLPPRTQAYAPSPRHTEQGPDEPRTGLAFGEPIESGDVDCRLNASYTFENFIEGDCNRLARSAALAIAENPGSTAFNPFLIYGGVGLGKTHLVHAIGNRIRAGIGDRAILYTSSDRFTNEFLSALQHNRAREFSQFYRGIDVLMIDDVQFFGRKEKTQEEFFHIFNDLHQIGKQIVLSADRPPRDIDGIEDRLLSRFQWGLTADLQAPGLETRMAILNRKASDDGIEFPPEVIEFIAHNVKSNIRELEGALIRLLAHATLHDEEIHLAMAKGILKDLIKESRVSLSIDQIQAIVCEYFNLDQDLVRAKTRKREVVQARQLAMYFSKELTHHSLKTIGLQFGGRDHSTVIHANRTVNDHLETDPKYRDMVQSLRQQLDLRSR